MAAYDFLFVSNCNYVCIRYRFRDIAPVLQVTIQTHDGIESFSFKHMTADMDVTA